MPNKNDNDLHDFYLFTKPTKLYGDVYSNNMQRETRTANTVNKTGLSSDRNFVLDKYLHFSVLRSVNFILIANGFSKIVCKLKGLNVLKMKNYYFIGSCGVISAKERIIDAIISINELSNSVLMLIIFRWGQPLRRPCPL